MHDELSDPFPIARTLVVNDPHKIMRNVTTKILHSVPQTKKLEMDFDQRLINETTGQLRIKP